MFLHLLGEHVAGVSPPVIVRKVLIGELEFTDRSK